MRREIDEQIDRERREGGGRREERGEKREEQLTAPSERERGGGREVRDGREIRGAGRKPNIGPLPACTSTSSWYENEQETLPPFLSTKPPCP
jgi:hypothetical protein